MKKPSLYKFVFSVIVTLVTYVVFVMGLVFVATVSDWKLLNDDSTETYPQSEPYETTVFLIPKGDFTVEKLAAWKADVERYIVTTQDQTDTVRITAVNYHLQSDAVDSFPVDLTITNMPAATLRKVVSPFQIEYTQTLHNPIALLPASEDFDYMLGYVFERRHSAANANLVTENEDGQFIYMWTASEPLVLEDTYPNRPLYYVLILLTAAVLGVIVFLTCRYCDCKKAQEVL